MRNTHSDAHGHGDSHTYPDCNSDSDTHTNTDGNGHSYCHCYSYSHGNLDAYACRGQTYADAQAAADASSAGAALMGALKRRELARKISRVLRLRDFTDPAGTPVRVAQDNAAKVLDCADMSTL